MTMTQGPADAPAPSAPAGDAPAPEPGGESAASVIAQAAAAKAARRMGRQAEPAPTPEPSAPEPAAEEPPPAAAGAGEEGSEPGGQSDDVDGLRTRLARTVNQARQYERKYRALEQEVASLKEAQTNNVWSGDDLAAKIEAAKSSGLTLREWTQHALGARGDLDAPVEGASSTALDQALERVAALEKAQQETAERERAANAQAIRAKEMSIIDNQIDSNEQWAVIKDLGRQGLVYDRFYEIAAEQGFNPALGDVLTEVAEHLVSGTKGILRSDRVRQIAKSDPELFAELRAAFAEERGEEAASANTETAPARRARSRGNSARRLDPNTSKQAASLREPPPATAADRKRRALERLASTR